jgi:sortase A
MRKTERMLFGVGLMMLGIYVGVRIHGLILSRAEVQRFKSQQVLARELDKAAIEGEAPDFTLWSMKRIKGYQESLANHFDPAMALLRIPKIHLEVPVLDGTDDISLNRAVGHIGGTPLPGERGNVGIAGHRDGFFRGLKDLIAGDTIEIMTQKGTDTYVIDQIVIVDPSDVSVLAPRPYSSLTLVTCYPFYFVGSAPQRYIVQAKLKTSDPVTLSAKQSSSF